MLTVRGAVIAVGIRKLSEILLSCYLMRLLPKGHGATDRDKFMTSPPPRAKSRPAR